MVGARAIWGELVAASREALPRRCLCCRRSIDCSVEGWDLCPRCLRALDESPGFELLGDGIDGGLAAVAYTGAGRDLVAALKFSRLLAVADVCAELIVTRMPAEFLAATVIPVPSSPVRSLTRGFDPADEIASRLARLADAPYRPGALQRRDLRRQRGRGRRSRLGRPPLIRAAEPVTGEVLVVDDVATTGATLDACARALRLAGATRVRAAVFATVPPPSRKIR